MIKVRLVSLIRSRASWAHVARKLCEAMQQMGVLVMIEEDDDGIIDSQLDIGEGVRRALNTRFPDPDVDLLIVRPERFQYYGMAPLRTAYMVFEADRWPEDWVALGTKNLELVLTPSKFCRDGLIASGMPGDRIAILPHGVDPAFFGPMPPRCDDGTFRILFVGTPSRRKGATQLLDAFQSDRLDHRRLSLTIKTEKLAHRYEIRDALAPRIAAVRALGARVTLIEDLYSEQEMARLYGSHDVLCSPHMGEGFGLCALEAMACARPIVATAWSGICDFFDRDAGWPITNFDLIDTDLPLPATFPAPSGARMAAPGIPAIAAGLNDASTASKAELEARGRAAASKASSYSWAGIAERYLGHVSRLTDRRLP